MARVRPTGDPYSQAIKALDDYTLDPFVRAKLVGMLRGYTMHQGFIYPQGIELSFFFPLINPETGRPAIDVLVSGKVDGLLYENGGWWIVEHKTSSGIDANHLRTLDINLQVHIYKRYIEMFLGIKVEGILYDIIMKPGIKPLKTSAKRAVEETPDEYAFRVADWYAANIEKAFYREYFRLRDIDIEKQVWMYHKEILWRRYNNHWPRNPDSCANFFGVCQYYPYCSTGGNEIMLTQNYEQKDPHPELPKSAMNMYKNSKLKEKASGNNSTNEENQTALQF
jgi:hypothetical protein